MQINEQPEVVKELQLHNDDATVQRLDEQSFPIQRGFYYQVPHTPLHPRGWHLRLYLKRKKLRRSNQLYAATDRIGTRWSLLPLCFFMLMLIFIFALSNRLEASIRHDWLEPTAALNLARL